MKAGDEVLYGKYSGSEVEVDGKELKILRESDILARLGGDELGVLLSSCPLPRALQIAVAAAQALDHVGLPEAQYALAQATVHIASSPKSDSVGRAYAAAMADVLKHGSLPVPNHLRTAGDRRMKAHGIGVGYVFPHDFEGDDVAQQYLPDELVGRRYYLPGDQGYEATIASRIADRQAAREQRPRRKNRPEPRVAGMSDAMRPRDENRKRLAETQKRDAADGG